MNLPNKLTVLRIIMVPFFVFFMLTDVGGAANKWIALALFVIASLTDMLDGKIARKYHLVTNFGKFMDPLADKLLVCSAMICLIPSGKLDAAIVIVIIAREFIISGFRLVASDAGISSRKTYDAWYNGNQVIDGETIVATATTVKIGGQGMLTEVYKDRIVFIDTFLASVKSVANAKFDAAGHLASPATLVLTVYDGAGATTDVRLTNGATNYTYSVGQYLLVNA